MKIGLVDFDSHNFPNLALMKISAWHKMNGDSVEFAIPIVHYDKVYVSRIFGDEYSDSMYHNLCFNADEVVYGGTGFAIKIQNGKEVYRKDLDKDLPYEIEHIYPDYLLYPQYTKDTAYGFLTRGCCNDCDFCIVSEKEGRCSRKVAELSEFWRGQKHIKLLDPNILACKDREDLLFQLAESGAHIDFTQGLDARFVDEKVSYLLSKIKKDNVHFALDKVKNENLIVTGLKNYKKYNNVDRNHSVYILTNFDSTIEQDVHRVKIVQDLGFMPDIRVYRKSTAPQILKDLQRWSNNRRIYMSNKQFLNYVPGRKNENGKTIQQLYFEVQK